MEAFMNLIRFAAAGALCLLLSLPASGYGNAPGLEIARSFPSTDMAASQGKKKKTQTNTQPRKKTYCGYPQQPNFAGMSDYCSMMYNIYCRRGVGCSIYGR
jgi:hypothetical protein